MKRISIKLAMNVPDDMTAGDLINVFGFPNGNLHINYRAIEIKKASDHMLKSGDRVSYAIDLK